MMYKLYTVSICCFLVFNCAKKSKNGKEYDGKVVASLKSQQNSIIKHESHPTNIRVDLDEIIEGNFDDYFDFKKAIFLDNSVPIGQISLIRQFKEKIFVLDKHNTKMFYCYNIKGELLWVFKSKGKGPLEYAKLTDFIINEESGEIDLIDSQSYKVISLDIETGRAKSEFYLGFYGREMALYDKENYLVYTLNFGVNTDLNYKLILVNKKQEVKSRIFFINPYEKDRHSLGFRTISKFDNTVYFNEYLNDTIYTIRNDTLRPSFYIDFQDKKYPENLKKQFLKDQEKSYVKSDLYVKNIDLIREDNGILNFAFSYKKKYYTMFYDSNSKKTYLFHKLKKGKVVGHQEQIFPNGYINDGFVKVIDPYLLDVNRKMMASNEGLKHHFQTNKPEFYNAMINTNENSNPVLFVYEFKKQN
ncbi:6-bladed beta-propeller [Seonamhaeicola sediminis]|uniref:6-bladed beta-propeller n=1 Tax=Seonamhaeicola sediminis TaxID=2528206 RepID=A0A562YBY4_9FLAO|nr:6-bladed beta-propeller [Seonamhaeicola sediminis]TWO31567.1 6-bladed beta-propeller [Seonamhaeicola sediminis]